jgi:hypothetical protein
MFLETSALTGENVEETFLKCARSILTKIESGKIMLWFSSDLSMWLDGEGLNKKLWGMKKDFKKLWGMKKDFKKMAVLKLSKHSDMTIHFKALVEHFLMVPLIFRFSHSRGKMHFLSCSK